MSELADVVEQFIKKSSLSERDLAVVRHLLASTCAGEKKVQRQFQYLGKEVKFDRFAIHRIRDDVKKIFGEGQGFTIVQEKYTLKLPQPIPTSAPMEDFSRLLYAMFEVAGIDEKDRSTKLKERLGQEVDGFFVLAKELQQRKIEDFDEVFRQFKKNKKRISVNDMRAIAEIFEFHPLLLYPLLIPYHDTGALALDLHDFVHVKRMQSPEREDRSTGPYSSPVKRLRLADATIGIVRLDDAHPKSDGHSHPGDEIALVLSGSIDFQLRQAGNVINLKEGDLIHFYAETEHQAFRRGKDAEMLVIRFYQTDAPTRHALWKELKRHLVENPGGLLPRHAAAWILQALPSYHPPSYQPIVRDELGLARMLDSIAEWKPGDARSSTLSAEEREALQAADPAAMSRVASLRTIAEAYDVEEFLLLGFGFPAVADKVILKRAPIKGSSDGARSYQFEPSDFFTFPKDDQKFSLPEHPPVRYRLPKRSLSCSDISIAHIELDPNAGTPRNSHPGLELIYLESGSLLITVDGSPAVSLSADGPQLCHFESSREHTVVNPGADVAKFWVIRFYRDGVPRSESTS